MQMVAPAGPMYQAGTLSGNPLAMTAGIVTLRELIKPGVFEGIAAATTKLVDGIQGIAHKYAIPIQPGHTGSMFGFYFLKSPDRVITDYATAKEHADPVRYGRFFHAMLARGVYFAPSQFEAAFVSSAHGEEVIDETLGAIEDVIGRLRD